ncbi:ABC transporter ATP-binding protein [Frankia sp. AgB1.9]|uniref:dipeptide ABC transporter ATP-binding protein n=1 Tax=unclassified Frankia TaxID=2632575 RepID=UPI001934AD1E|nr:MULTISPECIES: ABC transporter ATP-binding protein [unclassified Frankia]MBL7494162.1 ABC transporter ATP-binding protein [Frankia sp. AgW1.1]MBL7551477.1 ABC transporter ATP-binding protein [Frankia sp. AgB1.9]MBL7624692.1 ABC transporter ATP-binding protein [Frankia sp. AgB1.8]
MTGQPLVTEPEAAPAALAAAVPGAVLLEVDGLDVTFRTPAGPVRAARDVSFSVRRGECLAIVGESGSGKSVTLRALVGLTGGSAVLGARTLSFDGEDLSGAGEARWRSVRGRRIGLVLQDALVSLDPLRTVGAEVAETPRVHRLLERGAVPARVRSLLSAVGIDDPERRARQYSHQLSGGLRQRALIASAISADPELLLADEPTTALDVTVQARVLDLLGGFRADGTAIVLVSHDLAVVAGLADQVAVMYGGRIVERGPTAAVLGRPRHPYTRALLAAVPVGRPRGTRLSPPASGAPGLPASPDACPYAARCPLADDRCRTELPPLSGPAVAGGTSAALGSVVSVEAGHETLCWYPGQVPAALAEPVVLVPPAREPDRSGRPLVEVASISKGFRDPDGQRRLAVDDVSFALSAGEALGVVGESGSGKTTVARIVLGLVEPDAGSVRLDGEAWSGRPESERRPRRRRVQAVYQDPFGSFDPRYTVEKIIGEAVATVGVPRGPARRERVAELLAAVGLPGDLAGRRPLELSGGQRQRVAIARALAPSPDVLVCDEPVSALDVSVQAQILDLLLGLRHDTGVALLFISHDLGVVHHVSDRLLVMKDGRVVESGATEQIFARPEHPYTQELLAAVPRPPRPDEAAGPAGR